MIITSYVSYYHPDDRHGLSSGMFINKDYGHIALQFADIRRAEPVIVHEVTHNCLRHLRLPSWLNEGLARRVEKAVGRSLAGGFWSAGFGPVPPILDGELAGEHHSYWNGRNIQEFWAGVSFYRPDEGIKLSYNLGEILVELLLEDGGNFLDFLENAHCQDGGQDAALKCLGRSLGDVAATFLGPGDWQPNRSAMAKAWEQYKGAEGDWGT